MDLNVHLIHRITGLSKRGSDPTKHFVGKELDRQTTKCMKSLYNLQKGGRAFDAAIIEHDMVRFTVQLLAGRLLRTCHPIEAPATVVDLAHYVKEGVEYNWSLYLLNQFIEDYKAMQETLQPFHYSWLLIIIEFDG